AEEPTTDPGPIRHRERCFRAALEPDRPPAEPEGPEHLLPAPEKPARHEPAMAQAPAAGTRDVAGEPREALQVLDRPERAPRGKRAADGGRKTGADPGADEPRAPTALRRHVEPVARAAERPVVDEGASDGHRASLRRARAGARSSPGASAARPS